MLNIIAIREMQRKVTLKSYFMAIIRKTKQQVLATMWRKWFLCTSLMGMKNGAAAVEKSNPQELNRITM